MTGKTLGDGTPVMLTVHPALILRLTDVAERTRQMKTFTSDLGSAVRMVRCLQATRPVSTPQSG